MTTPRATSLLARCRFSARQCEQTSRSPTRRTCSTSNKCKCLEAKMLVSHVSTRYGDQCQCMYSSDDVEAVKAVEKNPLVKGPNGEKLSHRKIVIRRWQQAPQFPPN